MNQTRLLLVKPPSTTAYGYPATPPLGTGILATILKEAGCDVKAIDMRLRGYNIKKFLKDLNDFSPHIVGFSASSFEYLNTVALCKLIKTLDRDIITIVGGPHASMSPERTLAAREIDYIGIKEADIYFKDFVAAYPNREMMRRVAGIGYIDENNNFKLNDFPSAVSNLDELPFIDLALFPMEKYRVRGTLTIPLFTSRGCPYNCSFCTSFRIQGKRYRMRSPKSLVDEIEHNYRRFNTSYFTILDDTFNIDRGRVTEFCHELMSRNLYVKWECVQGIRADRTDLDIFKLMREAGCRQVAIGVESADEQVIKNMNKGEGLDVIEAAIDAANRAGLITKGFFIVGGPGDSGEGVLKSIRFFKRNKIYIPRFSMMTVYPGTPLETWVRENARFFYEPYEYVTRHNELAAAGVQFETDDFPAGERITMFKRAEREAEIWFIRNKLVDKFGRLWGRVLSLLFHLRANREMLRLAYKFNLVHIYS